MNFKLKKDLTGQAFGNLTAIKPVGRTKNRHIIWKCNCSCGNVVQTTSTRLIEGQKYCIDCANQRKGLSTLTHGMSKTGTYKSWCGAIDRTTNPQNKNFPRYGARGITICDRWRNSFEAFYEDMGERPEGASLERIDNNKGYEPGNCCWATIQEQVRNRRTNVLIELNGETKNLYDWDKELGPLLGLKKGCVASRIDKGWSAEKAFTTPRQKGRRPITQLLSGQLLTCYCIFYPETKHRCELERFPPDVDTNRLQLMTRLMPSDVELETGDR